jgi:hypothetical protein
VEDWPQTIGETGDSYFPELLGVKVPTQLAVHPYTSHLRYSSR